MTVGEIAFDVWGVPSAELRLVSSEGLAPLPLPQPLPDAVRRFQSALEEDEASEGPEVGLNRSDRRNRNDRNGPSDRSGLSNQMTPSIPSNQMTQTSPPPSPRPVKNPVNPVNPVQKDRVPGSPVVDVFKTGFTGFTGFTRLEESVSGGSRFGATVADNEKQTDLFAADAARASVVRRKPIRLSATSSSPATEPLANRSDRGHRSVLNDRRNLSISSHQSTPSPQINLLAPIPLSAAPAMFAPNPVNPVNPVQKTEAIVRTVDEIVEAVATQIRATPALASGDGEIRIVLKPTVLGGSEIRLTAKAGELTVTVTAATPAAARIAAAALPRLEAALAEHAPAFHHIAVVVAPAKKGKER